MAPHRPQAAASQIVFDKCVVLKSSTENARYRNAGFPSIWASECVVRT